MVNYLSLYPGATYLLDPSYNFIGYRVPTGDMGATTSIQTANQLKEVSKLLNQGMKTTEVSIINPEVFEMMPKNHLKEINRLNKLTGAESTLHAPVLDPSGFTEQGWSEENREVVEKQFKEVLERAHELNPDGNIPVTIHASQIPGSEMIPETHRLVTEKEKGKGPVLGRMIAVDQETGKFIPLEREKRFYPTKPEGEIYTPAEELKMANSTHWWNQLSQLVFYKERGDEIFRDFAPLVLSENDQNMQNWTPAQKAALTNVKNAMIFYENTHQSLNSIYNQAYKYSDERGKQALKQAAEALAGDLKKTQEESGNYPQYVMKYADALQGVLGAMQNITSGEWVDEKGNKIKLNSPQLYVPVEEFATKKAGETLSNVALNAYKKFGDKAPIVSIENPPYGGALASGKDLKKLVEATRQEFVNKLVAEGKSKTEAEKAAEKLIGVTWDTSHISMMRKQGFGGEQIVKETKEIAPFVKHLHYNDNFGSTHTDLPPGMGNLPFKDIMNELDKAKYKGKKIFEGGNFFQHFQTSPFSYQLETASSPVYMAGGGPFWNQLGALGNYYMGPGPINPPIHHRTYGAGFENLPLELGGEMPGGASRFSGTPNT